MDLLLGIHSAGQVCTFTALIIRNVNIAHIKRGKNYES